VSPPFHFNLGTTKLAECNRSRGLELTTSAPICSRVQRRHVASTPKCRKWGTLSQRSRRDCVV